MEVMETIRPVSRSLMMGIPQWMAAMEVMEWMGRMARAE